MELRFEVGFVLSELAQEEIAQQVVRSEPFAAFVERDEEQIRRRDLGEEPGRSRGGEHRVARRTGECIEHRRVDEEIDCRRRHRPEILVAQELGDQPVVACERLGGGLRIDPRKQRERREVQPGRPALGPVHERLRGLGGEPQAGGTQELVSLEHRQGEMLGPEVDQVPRGTQSAE